MDKGKTFMRLWICIVAWLFVAIAPIGECSEPLAKRLRTNPGVEPWPWKYSIDAVVLTLRIQEGVLLDDRLAGQVEAALAAVRARFPETRDVHAWVDVSVDYLKVCGFGPSVENWRKGEVVTGDPEADQLGRAYGVKSVKATKLGVEDCQGFRLSFSQPLKIPEVAPLYDGLPFVRYVSVDAAAGDSPDIHLIRKRATFYLVFKNAWGSCPTGCLWNHYHYFEYDTVTGEVSKRGELAPEDPRPDFYLWGVPFWAPVAPYADAGDLLRKCSTGPWWINLNALAVVDYLLDPERTRPGYGEDTRNVEHFERVRGAVLANRRGTLLAVAAALVNEDADVRREAARLLQTRAGQDFGQGEAALAKWREWLAAEDPQ